MVSFHTSADEESTWNLEEIYDVIASMFPVDFRNRLRLETIRDQGGDKVQDLQARDAIIKHIIGLTQEAYNNLEQRVNDPKLAGEIERAVLLRSIDTLWIEHLDHIDHLRKGIGLRGYGQRDPLGLPQQGGPSNASQGSAPQQTTKPKTPEGKKIGRNDPCYCGSGKKYKKCHGK